MTASPNRRRAAFLDRDGVLNEDTGYVFRAQDFVWRAGARETIKLLNDNDILVFVVTNQSGVARGLYGEDDVRELHGHMQSELAAIVARIDAFRYCPHHPQGAVAAYKMTCGCRKPESGMITDLLAAFELEPRSCRLFGDKDTDLAAGLAAGVPSHLVTGDKPLIDLVRAAFDL